jgi:hypothetical protein
MGPDRAVTAEKNTSAAAPLAAATRSDLRSIDISGDRTTAEVALELVPVKGIATVSAVVSIVAPARHAAPGPPAPIAASR